MPVLSNIRVKDKTKVGQNDAMVKYSLGHEVSSEHGCSTVEKQPPGAHCSRMRHAGSWVLSGLCVPAGSVALQRSPLGIGFPPILECPVSDAHPRVLQPCPCNGATKASEGGGYCAGYQLT